MKRSRSLPLLAALIVFMAGCSLRQQPEATLPTETAAPTEPTEWVLEETVEVKKYEGVELSFLSLWEEGAAEAAVLAQAAEVFEVRTGAAVQILWPSENQTAGDIVQISGQQLAGEPERFLDLTQLAEAAGYGEKSFSCLTDQVLSRCGFLAGIPQVPSVSGFYYNREVFESCGITQNPRNWEEFHSACAALASGGWQPLTLNSEDADDALLAHLAQYLGGAEAGNVASSGGWKNPQPLQAAADILELAGAGYLATGAPAAYPGGQNKITLSNSAMVYGTNALCPQAEAAALADLSWGMFPYPGVNGAEPVISVDAQVLAVSADCPEPQAAFDFIMLLTTGEFDQLRTDLTDGIPADPANESAIAGAAEAMALAQVVEPVQAELTPKQFDAVIKLWRGGYQQADAFATAMDAQY